MLKLILTRIVQGACVLLVVSTLTFGLLSAAGGDALGALRESPLVSERALAEMSRVYGLDQPLAVRYWRWLAGVLSGDFGQSLYFHAPVVSIIWPRLLRTLALAAVALSIAWAVALGLGWLAARRAGGWIDRLSELLILLTASTPRLVLALIMLALLARTSLFSIGGTGGMTTTTAAAGSSLLNIWPPAVVLCAPLVALFLAQARDNLRAALAEDFVQVARSKGLAESTVARRHALRAALNPLITIFGYSLGGLISGSVVVETVLGWPGLGELSVTAVRQRDVPLLLGVVLVTATAVLLGNLIADLLLRANDPRLRKVGGE